MIDNVHVHKVTLVQVEDVQQALGVMVRCQQTFGHSPIDHTTFLVPPSIWTPQDLWRYAMGSGPKILAAPLALGNTLTLLYCSMVQF